MGVTHICNQLTLACDTFDLVHSTRGIYQRFDTINYWENKELMLETAKTIVSVGIISLSIWRWSAEKSSLPGFVRTIKYGEMTFKLLRIPIYCVDLAVQDRGLANDDLVGRMTSLVALTVTFFSDDAVMQQEGYLQAFKDSDGTAKRPIWVVVQGTPIILGYRNIDPSACKAIIELFTRIGNVAVIARVAGKII